MNKIFIWVITVSLAGFLFGFDTAVISGADQKIQALWQTSPLFQGLFIMSSALWGTVIGALFGSIPCDRLGRKPSLILIAVLYIVGALGSALANDPHFFSVMRFLGGLGVGLSSVVVPAYIAEIAPDKYRGRMVASYQFQIVFGILAAFFCNYLLEGVSDNDWRWMLGIVAIPSVAFLLMVMVIPESPRWLILQRNEIAKASKILSAMGIVDTQKVVHSITESANLSKDHGKHLFAPEFRLPLLLAFLIAAFNQLSGINFIIYFAPRVFSLAGLDGASSMLSTAGIGLVNLVFTMIGLSLIDKLGRKTLMYIGSIGYIVSLSTVAWAFHSGYGGVTIVAAVLVFIASHAIGQGTVIWVFIAEVFPSVARARGQSFGASTHWVFAASITLLMPYFLSQFKPEQIFTFFAAMMVLQLAFVATLMPETSGKSIDGGVVPVH